MISVFYIILKDIFLIKIFKFSFWLFGHVENGLKDKVNFKIYDVIILINNYNTHIAQYAQRIQVHLRSCSWTTGTSQHFLPCQMM